MIGTKLGNYLITAKLGEGGMGEVWRATDSNLKREVAIKLLPAAFTADPERLARFEREAQLLAQLNHQNIAQVYGFEGSGESRALVMELVEGPTLADRLASGALPVEECVAIARQIAEAFEAAHDKGIVHRDLKPQNVKVMSDGRVKVLDFGLAKAMDPTAGSSSAADMARSPTIMNSPTVTAAGMAGGTQLGVILGTAAYMAPEQARGGMVDKRADIWAFGVVLYEMLTGRSLFAGPTVSDTLAGVLKSEVDWKALPAATPAALRRLMRRCLERNPKNRLHDIADARIALDEIASGRFDETQAAAAPVVVQSGVRPIWWIAGALGALVLGLVGGRFLQRSAAPPEPAMRFPLALPAGWKFADADTPLLAISHDGRSRAIAAVAEDGRQALLLGELGKVAWRVLPGTTGAQAPIFSPDGKWIAYFGDDKLMRVAVEGGPPLPVVEKVGVQTRGAVWLPDGSIVYSPDATSALFRIPAAGGAAVPLTELDKAKRERTHRWPDALPDGSAVIFTCDNSDTTEFYDDADIDAVVVATGERRNVLHGASAAQYLDPGILVFARGGTLFAVRFDPAKLETRGSPVPVEQEVATTVSSGAVQFAVASSGALFWAPGEAARAGLQPIWVDRAGSRSEALPMGSGNNGQVELAPDGRRLAMVIEESGKSDLWVVDLESASRLRLTFDGDVTDPSWSADGRRIAYARVGAAVGGGSKIFWKPSDGSGEAELLVGGQEVIFAGSFSSDGRFFIFDRTMPGTSLDLYVLSLDAGRRLEPFLATEAVEFGGRFSPDGRWIAYASTLAGQTEVYVRPFPSGGGRWQISNGGGTEPRWSADGRELFFRSRGTLFAAPIDTRHGFAAGNPIRIGVGFRPGDNLRTYSPAPDGKRFIALPGYEVSSDTAQVNFALHWDLEVRRRLADEP